MIFRTNIIEKPIENVWSALIKEEFDLIKTKMEKTYTHLQKKMCKEKKNSTFFWKWGKWTRITSWSKYNKVYIPMHKDTESLNLGVSFQ